MGGKQGWYRFRIGWRFLLQNISIFSQQEFFKASKDILPFPAGFPELMWATWPGSEVPGKSE